jgi:hypothetical protein
MPVGQARSPYESDPLFRLGQAQAVLTRLEGEFQAALGEQVSGRDRDSGTLQEVAGRLRAAKAAYEELLQICEARTAAKASPCTEAKTATKTSPETKNKPVTDVTRASGWVVEDAKGFDLRPDPLAARNPAELMEALRQYRAWADDPSYRQMARQAGRLIAASTLCVALRSNDLPRLNVVLAIVAGCGGGEEDQQRYATAWRQMKRGPVLRVVPPAAETG